MARPRLRKVVLATFILVLTGTLVAPFLSAERFAGRLREDLQSMLSRPVEIGEVRFTLWGGPGFLLTNLVIADHPDISAEPLAYVNEAKLHLSIASLWRRDLIFSRITLIQPSLNLAQGPDGQWNYQRLLPARIQDTLEPGKPLPTVRVEGARVNFRQGLRKSVYYFRNADLQLAEEGIGSDAWILDFRAEPARTDSFAPRFGTVRGNGRWRAKAGPDGELDIDVEVERSPLAELASLLGLPRVGLSGYVSARAHLSGPAANLSLRGNLELRELNEWTLLAGRGGERGVALEGTLNLVKRSLHLETVARQPEPLPYAAIVDVFPPESPGAWLASIRFDEIPVESLFEVVQYLDDSVPRYPALRGTLAGELEYHSQSGLRGAFRGKRLAWDTESGPLFTLRQLEMRMAGDRVEGAALLGTALPAASPVSADLSPSLDQTAETVDGKEPLPTEVLWDFQFQRGSGQSAIGLSGAGIRRPHLDAQALLVPMAQVLPPLLASEGWEARGALQWKRASYRDAGYWHGHLEARGFDHFLAGIQTPLRFSAGHLEIRGESWYLRNAKARIGTIPLQTEISYEASAERPYQSTLRAGQIDLDTLDRLLALNPVDDGGFLQRAFRRTTRRRQASSASQLFKARIYAESVLINSSTFTNFKGDLFWNGESAELRNISFRSRFGVFKGQATVDFRSRVPQWTCSLHGSHESWHGGLLQVELQRNARGGLGALFGNSAGEGQFTWRRPPGPDEDSPTLLRGQMTWSAGLPDPVICEHCVELRNGNGVWLGSCNQSNGTGYRCLLQDPQTAQQVEMEVPISMVGTQPK